MHSVWLWIRQGLSNKACIGLPQAVVPTFHVVCLPTFFANAFVRIFWKNILVGVPKITQTLARSIWFWDLLPKLSACSFASITNNTGYDLTCTTTHHSPYPAFVGSLTDKWPHFVRFQHIIWLNWKQGHSYGRGLLPFFSSQAASVWRLTPKIRSIPRMLGRS